MLGLLRHNLHDEQIEKTISVILRLPGLFLLDHWCQSSSIEIWTKVLDSTDLVSTVVFPFSKQEYNLFVFSVGGVHIQAVKIFVTYISFGV
jgi:hypothetical protein